MGWTIPSQIYCSQKFKQKSGIFRLKTILFRWKFVKIFINLFHLRIWNHFVRMLRSSPNLCLNYVKILLNSLNFQKWLINLKIFEIAKICFSLSKVLGVMFVDEIRQDWFQTIFISLRKKDKTYRKRLNNEPHFLHACTLFMYEIHEWNTWIQAFTVFNCHITLIWLFKSIGKTRVL